MAPVKGQYFENITPVTGKAFCEVARGTAEDIELALDAAHKVAPSWGKTSAAERAAVLNKIADRIDENLEMLAVAETWDNGKPIRETLNADIPLAADHFRYFASAVRAQEGRLSQLDDDTTAYHFHEPLGVVGQIIPWNFPILMAVWKLAPALAAGNAVVLKPAEQTPSSILVLMELIADLLPAGVLNVVNGFGVEAGKPLASSPRIRKIAFTGETTTGRLISQYASQNLIPVTLELGGKSPNIFFDDVADANDAFYDKALEGFTLYAFNQGEVCTCPSRALVQEVHLRHVHGRRDGPHREDHPGQPAGHRHPAGRAGLQRPAGEDPLLHRHRQAGGRQGAHRRRPGRTARRPGRRLLRPADHLRRHNNMRIFQEEIFGPVLVGDAVQRLRGRHCTSPTTPCTGSAPASGPATATWPTAPAARSRPAGSGSTTTTRTRPALPSAGTSPPASAAKTTR